jgi:hypothetical protein
MNILKLIILCLLIPFDMSTAQNVIFNQTDTSLTRNIRLEISSDKSNYKLGDTIFIKYRFYNISKTNQKVLLKDYWGFPMGMNAMILDHGDSSICGNASMHVYSSNLYTEKQLVDYYKTIEPGKFIEGKVVLQDIPVFKDRIKDRIIPVDKYKVNLIYIWLKSNTILIDIKK